MFAAASKSLLLHNPRKFLDQMVREKIVNLDLFPGTLQRRLSPLFWLSFWGLGTDLQVSKARTNTPMTVTSVVYNDSKAAPSFITDAEKWFMHLESLKVINGGISFLDFAGSCMVCYNFRQAIEK